MDPVVDGSIASVAQRIQARRDAGQAPVPDGPIPEALQQQQQQQRQQRDDGYVPSQNVNTDDDDDDGHVTPEDLRKAALGDDDDDLDDVQDDLDDDDQLAAQDGADDVDEDEPGADDGGQDIELNFSTVDELADLVGMDVEDLLSRVSIDTLVDGELGSITLADLKKGHQLESSFTRKNQAFVTRVKNWEAEVEAQRTQIADHFAQATTVLNHAQQALYQDFQNVNWADLEANNPAEWSKKRQQFGERQQRLNTIMQQTTQQLEVARQKQLEQEEEARENRYAESHELLMAAVPIWKKDEKRRMKEGTQIAEYLVKEMGFTPDEIENMADHRIILLGRAALGLAGPSKQKLRATQKKVDQVKTLVKGGQGNRRNQGQNAFTKQAQDAKARLKQSGATHDAAAALLARKRARAASAKRGRTARV